METLQLLLLLLLALAILIASMTGLTEGMPLGGGDDDCGAAVDDDNDDDNVPLSFVSVEAAGVVTPAVAMAFGRPPHSAAKASSP